MKNYIKLFLNHSKATKNLSVKTILAYQSDLQQFASTQIDMFHPDIYDYINYLSQSLKLKDTSIRRKIVTLKCFYSFLSEQKLIEISPSMNLKFKFRLEKQLPKTLTTNEVSKLLNCLNFDITKLSTFKRQLYIRDCALLELLISTGVRIGEAAAIALSSLTFP